MAYSRKLFIKEFARSVNESSAAVFVGAGISQGAGYPGWESLVTDMAQRLGLPNISDLIALGQFVVNRDRNRTLINRRIVEEFTRPRSLTRTHIELAELPLKAYWTTNYDNLIERAIAQVRGLPEVKKNQEDLARHIPGRVATVFKMHGDAESPQEAVLIRDDYENYQRDRELFSDVFTSELLANTFLFLGVSFTDPNLNFLLGRLRSIFDGARKDHFWVSMRPQNGTVEADLFDLRVDDLQRYGIRTITVESYAEVSGILAEVSSECRTIRRRNSIFFSGSVRDSNPKAAEIREFAQKLGAEMVLGGRTIITGLGRGIGTWVTTAALEALYSTTGNSIHSDRVIARPFPVGSFSDPEARRKHRVRMISEAGFSIFISGRGEAPSGTKEEFAIARTLSCYVLPVGVTGSDSADLWSLAFEEIEQIFGARRAEVEPLFLKLNNGSAPMCSNIETVSKIIDLLQD